jgi:hypothetical protein
MLVAKLDNLMNLCMDVFVKTSCGRTDLTYSLSDVCTITTVKLSDLF